MAIHPIVVSYNFALKTIHVNLVVALEDKSEAHQALGYIL